MNLGMQAAEYVTECHGYCGEDAAGPNACPTGRVLYGGV